MAGTGWTGRALVGRSVGRMSANRVSHSGSIAILRTQGLPAGSPLQSGSCASDRPAAICNPAGSTLAGVSTLHKDPSSRVLFTTLAAALALSACGGSSPSASEDGQVSEDAQASEPAGEPVPAEEPSESDIVAVLEHQYDQINAAGGMPVTATASGTSTVLKPKIWEAHKDEPCRSRPQSDPGEYECSLNLMVTFREGDDVPGEHAERVFVSWDEVEGEWVGAEVLRERRKQRK